MRVMRTAVLLGVVGAVAVGLAAGLASAAGKPNSPTITFVSPSPAEGATLTTNSVTFEFTYNRHEEVRRKAKARPVRCRGRRRLCRLPATTLSTSRVGRRRTSSTATSQTATTRSRSYWLSPTAARPRASRHFAVNVPVTGHLYWANFGTGIDGTINMAGLDGSNPQTIASGQSDPSGVAVDASHLYWVNHRAGTITMANLDGSNPQTIVSGRSIPSGWTSTPATSTGPTKARAVRHGDGQNGGPGRQQPADDRQHPELTLRGRGRRQPPLLGRHRQHPYGEPGRQQPNQTIHQRREPSQRACGRRQPPLLDQIAGRDDPYGGPGRQQPADSIASGQGFTVGVAVDATHLYWSSFASTIVMANLDGTTRQTFVTGQTFVQGWRSTPANPAPSSLDERRRASRLAAAPTIWRPSAGDSRRRGDTSKRAPMTTTVSPTLLTTAEVARLLRLHRRTVERMVRRRELPARRVGRRLLIDHADVIELLDGRRV